MKEKDALRESIKRQKEMIEFSKAEAKKRKEEKAKAEKKGSK